MKLQHLVVYISFDYEILKRIHALDPAAVIQYLTGDKTPDELKQTASAERITTSMFTANTRNGLPGSKRTE